LIASHVEPQITVEVTNSVTGGGAPERRAPLNIAR
jgi:hypothetical protein